MAFVQAEVAAASVEEAPAPSLPPRIWDGRLDGLGVSLREAGVGSGQQFWRLIEVRWQNEQEGGGKHNIYVETLDEGGNRLGLFAGLARIGREIQVQCERYSFHGRQPGTKSQPGTRGNI